VAEVLESRILRMIEISDLGREDIRPRRSGEEQELIDLVRCDVADDASIAFALKEPCGSSLRVHAMRSESYGLDDPADRHGLYEFAGSDRRLVLKALAVQD